MMVSKEGVVAMTVNQSRTKLQIGFAILVGGLLLVSLMITAKWVLAGLAFISLLVLNGQFIVFPVTWTSDWLNRASLIGTLALVVLTLIKFLVLSSL
jgi:hypothetical protein